MKDKKDKRCITHGLHSISLVNNVVSIWNRDLRTTRQRLSGLLFVMALFAQGTSTKYYKA
jgi:uncharacterized membrane protein YiaA